MRGGVSRKAIQTAKRFACLRFRLPTSQESIFREIVVVAYLAGAKSIFDLAGTTVSDGPEPISGRRKSIGLTGRD